MEACQHEERIDGVCVSCGHCVHEVIVNRVCYFCGAVEPVVTVKPAQPVVPASRLVRRRGSD